MNIHVSIDKEVKKPRRDCLPVPADFAEVAITECGAQLRERYGVGDKTLARWRKEAGVPAPNGGRMAAQMRWGEPKEAPSDFKDFAGRLTNRQLADKWGVSEKRITQWRKDTGCTSSIKPYRSAQLPNQVVPPPPSGLASEACQFLRPNHRPVYHREIEGKQFKGQYVVGTKIMSETEIVDYARSKGFKTGAETLREWTAFSKYD